jgi:peptide/nickel transport system substrate-binding protein
MSNDHGHPAIPKLCDYLAAGKMHRREFIRFATLLGMSAGTAYTLAGLPGGDVLPRARAQDMPKGGTLRLGNRVKEILNPHTFSWGNYDSNVTRQVVEYLTITGHDNVTRPYLVEKWEVSDDLKTWTLRLRQDVKWHSGRPFVADDVVWNLQHVLDPATGSSVLGLMKGYMIEEVDTGQKDEQGNPKLDMKLWDANAIEKVDDHAVRLNCKVPQIAVPEHLFHYPLGILDPEEKGEFKVGSNGTGPFELVEFEVGRKAVLQARKEYWGDMPHIERLEFIDVGDDPAAAANALTSGQIHGLVQADPIQYEPMKRIPGAKLYQVPTAETAVMRMKVTEKPFDNPKVRQAVRLALDSESIMQVSLRGLGTAGEHHHVSHVHPEYAKLPVMKRDVEGAKKLLAEAGHPNGIDIAISVPKDPPFKAVMVQAAVEQWKEAGIRTRIDLMPAALYWDVWTKVPFGATIWYHRPLGIMVLGLAYRTGVPWNESSYANAEFDKLLTEAEGIIDPDERRKLMEKLETIMQEDGPIAQPVWRNNFTFMNEKVQGFEMHPTSYVFGNRLAVQS